MIKAVIWRTLVLGILLRCMHPPLQFRFLQFDRVSCGDKVLGDGGIIFPAPAILVFQVQVWELKKMSPAW